MTTALLPLVRRLLLEEDPAALLRSVCAGARQLIGAQVAAIGITPSNRGEADGIVTDPPLPPSAIPRVDEHMQRRIEMRQPVRDPSGALLVAPFATAHNVYGWLALADKPGGFDQGDEETVVALAGVAAAVYENATLLAREDDIEFALAVARVGLSYRDVDADHLAISRSLADLLGLAPGARSISRAELFTRIHPDDVARVQATVGDAIRHGTEFHLEYRLHAGDRGWRWCRSNGRVRVNLQGRPRLFTSIADVTERRSLESQLQQAQKMEALGQLAGGVAHDFNNFLTAILGYGRFLAESVPEDGQRRDAEEIVKAAERAASLTKQLLAFGRRQVMETETVNVNTLVTDMADMLRRIIGEQIELTTTVGAEMPMVTVGHGQLEQVVLNLVVNARDAIAGGGTINITTADVTFDRRSPRPVGVSGGKYVMVAVSDSGRGMDEETKARLFEPFFTTKPRAEGSGLGLATVYGIVTQRGGSISVSSEPGSGSVFRIYLPRHEQAVRDEVARPAPISPRGAETVLLVEDEPAVRRLARIILERAGYTVIEAANPDEGEAVAETTGTIDLLLTDVIMPGGTGPDLFRRLAPGRPGLRVLFMSGYAEKELFDRDTISRTDAFVAKPFSAATLVAKVRQSLDR